MKSLNSQALGLIDQQTRTWELARRNYTALEGIQTRTIDYDGFSLSVQFNPDRAGSTTARVDAAAQAQTSCFLCRERRPPEQQAIPWNDYDILINPYPIFAHHLTIPHRNHTPQRITGRFADLMGLARDLEGFLITFNGAQSGASIPSHHHFQAVGKGNVPLEAEAASWRKQEVLSESDSLRIRTLEHYLRRVILVEGTSADAVAACGEGYMRCFSDGARETEINALAWSTPEGFRLAILPRTARRPWQYHATGDEQIFFSPGAVDMAGVVITVRERDYQQLSPDLLTNLFGQVIPSDEAWAFLKKQWQRCF